MNNNDLSQILKQLKMPGALDYFTQNNNEILSSKKPFDRLFYEILNYESNHRRTNRIQRMLKASNLPIGKTLNEFDLSRLSIKLKQKVKALLDGEFLSRKENVLAFGKPGVGKTHLLSAIGHEMILQDHRILFIPCNILAQRLLIAKKDLKLENLFKKMDKFEAIIIDDIGYVQQEKDEVEALFVFLANRYERGSIMITSNLPFSKWNKIFKDPMTTAAAIDRIVHHSIILEINSPGYRQQEAKKKNK